MKALRGVLTAVTAAAMGVALAALPHTQNDPCIERLEEVVGNPHREFSWFPLGHRCVPGDFVGASAAATVAWMAFAGLLAGAAVWRPTRVTRGALVAGAALTLMGVIYMRVGPFVPALMSTAVLAAPVAYAMVRGPGVLLVPVALSAWAVPYLGGHGDLANLTGIAAGAGAAWALGRIRRAEPQ